MMTFMKCTMTLMLLLPLIFTGAQSSKIPCNCGTFAQDTMHLKKIIIAKVDSFTNAKLEVLDSIKKDLLDTSGKPEKLILGHIDVIRTLGGNETSFWMYRKVGPDTLFVRRDVSK